MELVTVLSVVTVVTIEIVSKDKYTTDVEQGSKIDYIKQ